MGTGRNATLLANIPRGTSVVAAPRLIIDDLITSASRSDSITVTQNTYIILPKQKQICSSTALDVANGVI